jgi:hypothetical protein
MNERLLQFIWQHQYFSNQTLRSITGSKLEILTAGSLNNHQGPDFQNARVWIDGILLVGTIELHIKTSDWNLHKHHQDPHYNNVILHVVWEHNTNNVSDIPILELKGRVAVSMLEQYDKWMNQEQKIPCASQAAGVPELIWKTWKERLAVERIGAKVERMIQQLQRNHHNREETCWQILASGFGMPYNTEAFEAIARSIPYKILLRHRHQIHQTEALLLGQAGLLESSFNDPYPLMLQKEYIFLRTKYGLKAPGHLLRFLRMRPSGFPTIRLAQLSMLIHQHPNWLQQILHANELKDLLQLLRIEANDFWHTHYVPEEPAPFKIKRMGRSMIDNMIINTFIPLILTNTNQPEIAQTQDKVLEWLVGLQKENHSITREWEKIGLEAKNALDSQALLQLQKHYCAIKSCLSCSIGNNLLKNNRTTS